jgi:hypothetical protein
MRFSYKITPSGLFLPHYQKESDSEPKPFLKKHVDGQMKRVCIALSHISAPRPFREEGQWYLAKTDKSQKDDDMQIFFTQELYVMAFIGAAQHWFLDGKFPIKEVANIIVDKP